VPIHRNYDDSADLATTYAYDASGNLTSVTDANGTTTTYHYDLFNRLEQVIQPGNTTTTYAYDPSGSLTTVTDAEGHVTSYTYDDLGRLVQTDSPDTGVTLYSYDEGGNLRFKVQNNNSIEYRYDALGRLTNILYSDPAQNVTMTYDSGAGANLMGRLASVADASGLTEYSYDDNGHLEMETRTVNGIVYVTGYSYDAAGNLRSITYPTGQTIDYQPDPADPARISTVVLNPSGSNQILASAITYKPFGPAAAMTLGNGIAVTKTYDKNYQLLSLAAGAILDRDYIPDNVGNIQLITDNLDSTRSQSFDYDDLYRLTSATGIYGTVAFTYDKVGNRLTRTQTGTTSSQDSYTYYPGTNRLQTVIGNHPELLQYDVDGNITHRVPGTGNPQPPITDPADYIYNSAGQRAFKDAANDVVYHYDLSGQLIAETDAVGNMLKAYVWLFGQPLAMIAPDGAVYYFLNDHLGTPQKMTDSSGTVVWAADYLPYGQADVTIATVENNLRFAGQYFDSETGLHYNYYRYYDPKLGRYLRVDPYSIAFIQNDEEIMDNILQFKKFSTINQLGKNRHISDYEYYKNIESSYREALFKKLINNPSQQNVYTYVQNNPINHIDPKGLIQTPCEDERFFCQRTCSMICIAATVPDMGPEIIPLCLLSCKVACDSAYHCNCH
jgi:RHS repeat-associated protein